ncbi:DUF6290 family protein [Leuconostoc suionicum]|uniref:DUF6290 family protein n=1 Tax=Leuconostoc suionicum TaxID=1511761 RepID=UPI004035083A
MTKTLHVRLADDDYEQIKKYAEFDHMSLSDYVRKTALHQNLDTNLYERIIYHTTTIASFDIFTVKEALAGEWETFSRAQKVTIGKRFAKQITDNNKRGLDKIVFATTPKNKPQRYQFIG